MSLDWKTALAGLSLLLPPFPMMATTAANEMDVHAAARATIRSEDLQSHVSLLADDTLEGREAGSRGGYTAGNYLVRHFQGSFEPAGDGNSYFQVFQGSYRNLIGVLRGSDPALQHEFILLGAHYDHVGYGTRQNSQGPIGVIHNGADDNASGTSAVLEVMEAFVTARVQTRRSIVFALWDGEEKGLLGSEHWAQHPTVPLTQVKFVINIDMIGRLGDKPLEVIGTRTMPGLRRLITQANYPDDIRLTFPWDIEENSDHHTFFQRSIPFVMFHTGLHDDYHRPTDDPEYLDLAGLQRVSRLLFNTVTRLADRDELAACRVAARHENEARRREFERPLPLPAPRLGITWDRSANATAQGVLVESVRQGSAADAAGLLSGDRLVKLDGQPLLSSSTLQQAVVVSESLALEVERPGFLTPLTLQVKLEGTPSRIGISWRSTPAEPKTVTVVRVLPHSPASQAGIRPGDRIHQIDGQDLPDSQSFYGMTQAATLPTNIVLEREGRLIEVTLPSPLVLSPSKEEA